MPLHGSSRIIIDSIPVKRIKIARRIKGRRIGDESLLEYLICFGNADDLFRCDVGVAWAGSRSHVFHRPPDFPAFWAVRILVTTGGSEEHRNNKKWKKFHGRFDWDDIQFGRQLQTFCPLISVESGPTHFNNHVKLSLRERHHGEA